MKLMTITGTLFVAVGLGALVATSAGAETGWVHVATRCELKAAAEYEDSRSGYRECRLLARSRGTFSPGYELVEADALRVGAGAHIGFTGKGGTSDLETAGANVSCSTDSLAGEVTGETTVGDVIVTFSGCKGKDGSGAACTVKSAGSPASGLIITKTLDGELGLAAESSTKVGLLLLPKTAKTWLTLEGTCLEPETSAVEGTLVGEVVPVGALSPTGKLTFAGSAGVQKIKSIFVLGATVKPRLTAFGLSASENAADEIEFEEVMEVT